MKKKTDSTEFITKGYFEETLIRLLHGIRNEIIFAISNAVDEMEKRVKKINDINLTKLDSIAKELEEMREDRILSSHQTPELRKRVDHHERRISRLEKSHSAA